MPEAPALENGGAMTSSKRLAPGHEAGTPGAWRLLPISAKSAARPRRRNSDEAARPRRLLDCGLGANAARTRGAGETALVLSAILEIRDAIDREEARMNDIAESYVCGLSDASLIGQTIGNALERAAIDWADQTALISRAQGVQWNWRELRDRADAFAAGLMALGLRRGDRIGIWSLNRAEWAVTQFAAARAGFILVTINPAYRLSELEFALNKAGCSVLVTATAFKNSDYLGMVEALAPELIASKPGKLSAARLPHLRTVIQIGGPKVSGTMAFDEVSSLGGETERAELRSMAHKLQFDDAINIQFTSGTTGSPKGVTLTHHNILNNGYFVGRAMRLTAEDRICIPVPLYHCFGMVMGNLAAVTHGCAMVYRRRGVRSAEDVGNGADRAMHRALWRPHDVHFRTRSCGVRAFRSQFPANRNHGGRALSDRGDAAGWWIACICAKSRSPME